MTKVQHISKYLNSAALYPNFKYDVWQRGKQPRSQLCHLLSETQNRLALVTRELPSLPFAHDQNRQCSAPHRRIILTAVVLGICKATDTYR